VLSVSRDSLGVRWTDSASSSKSSVTGILHTDMQIPHYQLVAPVEATPMDPTLQHAVVHCLDRSPGLSRQLEAI
jgi:hypothetical protein